METRYLIKDGALTDDARKQTAGAGHADHYIAGYQTEIVFDPVDGPPVPLSVSSFCLTEIKGGAVAVVGCFDPTEFAALRNGQLGSLSIREGGQDGVLIHGIARCVVACRVRFGEVEGVNANTLVFAEL